MPSVRLNPSAVCAACVLALLCLLGQARAAEPQPHWAFQPVRKPALPAVKATKWVRSPVDAFVLAPLEQRRWEPSPAASRAEWLRRVTLDLTGLPPTPEEAEEFVRVIQQQTGRLPLVYIHPGWANGQAMGRRRLRIDRPITSDSILARCDLWLADYREQPEVPDAWARRGWKFWQYVADESEDGTAYGATPRAIPGITHCDRNMFNGDAQALTRYWGVGGQTGV